MVRINCVDTERRAEMACFQHSGCGFDHFVALVFWQFHAFMIHAANLKAVLEELGEKLLTRDGIVGQVLVVLECARGI